ncbi:MAG: hypothetical protein OHK0053_29950 [Microscillaceae bacterium]
MCPSGELQLLLNKLNTLGSALYLAAHPDDENTALIAALAQGRRVRTAYLSLTRGDGGQNLIGPEQKELLGLIRTHELLQARRIDGGEQFFTRANDFGFSKDARETFQIWDKEAVLSDVVWVIRKFRPDVIITRFPPTREAGHGHHEASCLLAIEAFEAAADPTRFPEQLAFVKPWQARRLFWNCYSRRNGQFSNVPPDSGQTVPVLLSEYEPLLGKTYTVIAAESRSMHRSQGFGSARNRDQRQDFLLHLAGEPAQTDLFDGIDLTWGRVKNSEQIAKLLQEAQQLFRPDNPAAILPILLQARTLMAQYPPGESESHWWLRQKKQELEVFIRQCAGLWLEASATEYASTPGDSLEIRLELLKQLPLPVPFQIKKADLKAQETYIASWDSLPPTFLKGQLHRLPLKVKIPENTPLTHPYWLWEQPSLGMFQVNERNEIGKPQNSPALLVELQLQIGSEMIKYQLPVMYKWVEPEEGELYRTLELAPALMVKPESGILMFAQESPQELKVTLKAGRANVQGTLIPELPDGWYAKPSQIDFHLKNKGQEETLIFQITPPASPGEAQLQFRVLYAQRTSAEPARSFLTIRYPHIPIQTIFPESHLRLVRFELTRGGKNIGYIAGAGDDLPQCLRQVGYQVNLLQDQDLQGNLGEYDAIVVGVRAFNTQDWLRYRHKNLLEYVQKGGRLVVQYHTPWELVVSELGPYPFSISRDRVTVENAPVAFLKPDHPLLNFPNRLQASDFEGWVQERGLYFAGKRDERYEALVSTHDPDEKPLDGALIYAQYGQGEFIYTGFSFFRELPAGVPGAYRFFANLLASMPAKENSRRLKK